MKSSGKIHNQEDKTKQKNEPGKVRRRKPKQKWLSESGMTYMEFLETRKCPGGYTGRLHGKSYSNQNTNRKTLKTDLTESVNNKQQEINNQNVLSYESKTPKSKLEKRMDTNKENNPKKYTGSTSLPTDFFENNIHEPYLSPAKTFIMKKSKLLWNSQPDIEILDMNDLREISKQSVATPYIDRATAQDIHSNISTPGVAYQYPYETLQPIREKRVFTVYQPKGHSTRT
jgi:hypothetical protein